MHRSWPLAGVLFLAGCGLSPLAGHGASSLARAADSYPILRQAHVSALDALVRHGHPVASLRAVEGTGLDRWGDPREDLTNSGWSFWFQVDASETLSVRVPRSGKALVATASLVASGDLHFGGWASPADLIRAASSSSSVYGITYRPLAEGAIATVLDASGPIASFHADSGLPWSAGLVGGPEPAP
jgi:hypothetical protein